MPLLPARALALGTAVLLLVLSGCGSGTSLLRSPSPAPAPAPKDTILVADHDTTALAPELARLYVLHAELLATDDSVRQAHLLNRSMTKLAALLRSIRLAALFWRPPPQRRTWTWRVPRCP